MPLTGLLAGARAYGMFSAAQASDFQLIQSITVGSGGASSVTFSNIPQTYTHLQVRGIARYGASNTSTFGMGIRFNGDTGSNYAVHNIQGNGSTASSGNSISQTFGGTANIPPGGNTASAFAAFTIDILDYASTSKNKTVRTLAGYDGNDTNGLVTLRSALWMNTSATTSLVFLDSSGNSFSFVQHSTFSLYGIR